VRQQHDEGRLADIGGFPRHVRSGEDGEACPFGRETAVVRDEGVPPEDLFHHRMAPVLDEDLPPAVHLRTPVPVLPRKFGEREERVELGDPFRRRVNGREGFLQRIPQREEELLFRAARPSCARSTRPRTP